MYVCMYVCIYTYIQYIYPYKKLNLASSEEAMAFLGVGKNFIVNVDPIEFQDAEAMESRASALLGGGGVLSALGFRELVDYRC